MKSLVRTFARKAGYDVRRLHKSPSGGKTLVHFLHIGKAAGSQILNVASQVNAKSATKKIVKHDHDFYLKHLPGGEAYFFSIRNPISRFRSGFYSRKRKGQPRTYSEWSASDTVSFGEFEHANDLAESLFEPGLTGQRAWAAMKSIRHTSQNQADWFDCVGHFLEVRPPIWILRQEQFDSDFETFFARADLGLARDAIEVSRDKVTAHANDYTDIPPLSEKAKANLAQWYVQDIAFYDLCTAWMAAEGASNKGRTE